MTDSDTTATNSQAATKTAVHDLDSEALAVQAAAEEAAAQGKTADEMATADHAGAGTGITETLDATVGKDSPAPALQEIKESPYDPDRYRDTTRSYIAYWLLGLLTLVVLFSFMSVILFSDGKVTFDNLKSLLELLMGPIIALVSAATGFYFGSQQSNNSKKT